MTRKGARPFRLPFKKITIKTTIPGSYIDGVFKIGPTEEAYLNHPKKVQLKIIPYFVFLHNDIFAHKLPRHPLKTFKDIF